MRGDLTRAEADRLRSQAARTAEETCNRVIAESERRSKDEVRKADKEHRRQTDIAVGSVSPQKLYGVPVGLMFAIMGVLLVGYGVFGDHAIYARSLDINVNVIWGSVLFVTGALLWSYIAFAGRTRAMSAAR